MNRLRTIVLAAVVALAACAPAEDVSSDAQAGGGDEMDTAGQPEPGLGPVDGHDLPPTDLERVQEGDTAPDFTLTSLAGPPVSLSDFRGEKNVVLVFYRGHW